MSGKYTPETLLPALRLFIEARNKANAAGFLITAALFIQWNASLMFLYPR